MNFSVAIIALDAATTIGECLKSVVGLTDDIVVIIDDRTSDSTAQICKRFGARAFLRRFDNFSSQKNYAVSQTKHNWVLSLDADEEISPELVKELSTINYQQSTIAAYSIPCLNYIFGRPIYHTNWSPENHRHVWLFDKTKCRWEGAVHEHVLVTGSVGRLKGHKIHRNYQSVEQFMQKLNHYTSFEARNKTFNPILLFIYPFWKFVRHYIVFLGFLDGWHGLFLSYLQALYGLTVYVKSWASGYPKYFLPLKSSGSSDS